MGIMSSRSSHSFSLAWRISTLLASGIDVSKKDSLEWMVKLIINQLHPDVRPSTVWIDTAGDQDNNTKLVAPIYARALIDLHKSNPFLTKSVEDVIPEPWCVAGSTFK
jgi:hypothetical protein